jgi:hypothetical protein
MIKIQRDLFVVILYDSTRIYNQYKTVKRKIANIINTDNL